MFVEFGQARLDRPSVRSCPHRWAVPNLSHAELSGRRGSVRRPAGLLGLVAVFFPEPEWSESVRAPWKGKVGEEGPVLVGFDEVGGFLPEPKGQGFSSGSGFEVGVWLVVRVPPRGLPTSHPPRLISKPWSVGHEPSDPRCHLPAKRFVARILHGLRERDFGGPEVAFVFGRKVAVMPAPLAPSFSRGIPNP